MMARNCSITGTGTGTATATATATATETELRLRLHSAIGRRFGSVIVQSLPVAVSFCLVGQLAGAVFCSVQAAEPDSVHQGRYVQRGPVTPLGKAPVSPDTPVSSDSSASGDVSVSPDTAVSSDSAAGGDASVSPDTAVSSDGSAPNVGSEGEGAKAAAVNDISPAEKARLEREKAAQLMADALHNEAIDHYELARTYLSQWNTEMAEMELKASIMCEPGMKAAHRDYVIVSLMRFNPLKALAEMMMVVGLGEPVPFSDEQKTKIKDDNAKAHYEKGIALARESNWQEAITEYQWAMTYHPNDARISRSLAFAYGSAGNFEQAEKEYATSFAQDPGDAFTHADLAFLLDKSGDKQKALEQMKTTVELQPKAAALHVDLGWLAEARGDLGLASTEFATAVQLSPRHAALWAHLGKILARQGENSKAREAYEKALALDPKQIDAEQGLQSLNPIGSPEGSHQGLPNNVAPGASPAAPAPAVGSEIKKAG